MTWKMVSLFTRAMERTNNLGIFFLQFVDNQDNFIATSCYNIEILYRLWEKNVFFIELCIK